MNYSRFALVSFVFAGFGGALAIACSDDPATTPAATTDAGPKSDASKADGVSTTPVDGSVDPVGPVDGGADTKVTPSDSAADTATEAAACTPVTATYAGCTAATYVDVAAAPGTIAFGGTALGNVYKEKCLKIKANQAVTWSGDFTMHPLRGACNPATGGTVPSTSTGSSASVTFTAPGFYGYYCDFHGDPSGVGMSGVIQVY